MVIHSMKGGFAMVKNINYNKVWFFLKHLGIFMLFLTCGLSIFFVNITFSHALPDSIRLITKVSICFIYLTVAYLIKKNEALKSVFFAFFTASAAVLISQLLSSPILNLSNLSVNTPQGIALSKFFESLFIVLPIILFTVFIKKDLGSIYIKKGEMKSSIVIGLTSFVILTLLAASQTSAQNIQLGTLIPLLPWILIFVISNGFMEELLFRGLFLKKYSKFLGLPLSNLLTAIIFTLAHIQVKYTSALPVFLIITFLFALTWGFIMQKTDNIWGSTLFHAGADIVLIIQIFKLYVTI